MNDVLSYLNEVWVRLDENVWELIRCVDLVKKRINVIVLNKVTAARTNKIECTRYDWWSIGFACYFCYLGLVLLVILQLLAQRNSMLSPTINTQKKKMYENIKQRQRKTKKESSSKHDLKCLWKYYIKLCSGVIVSRSSWSKISTNQEVFPCALLPKISWWVWGEAYVLSCFIKEKKKNSLVTVNAPHFSSRVCLAWIKFKNSICIANWTTTRK